MKFYVYILKEDNIPFYVGKGTKDRMYYHFKKAKNSKLKSPVLDKIRKMIKENKKIIYEKIFITDDENLAFMFEIKTIQEIGRRILNNGPLLNLTEGGEGVRGYIFSEIHKKNLSISMKTAIKEKRLIPPINTNNREYMQTDEYKKIMSDKTKSFFESKEGDEMKKNLSKKLKSKLVNGKRILSDESRRKMGAHNKKKE